MTLRRTRGLGAIAITSLFALGACSQAAAPTVDKVANTKQDNVKTVSSGASEYGFIDIKDFDRQMGDFVGLTEGESYTQSKPKIGAVFTAYDGHAEPRDIRTENNVVEAGWTQVLVTQDGLMDGTVTAQQLLVIYDQNDQLVTYGMRIKCGYKIYR